MVLRNSNSRWVVAMSLDECIHYSGEGQMLALTKESGFTRADVWRASVKAEAHGCKEIVTPASEPTSVPTGGDLPEEADSKQADDESLKTADAKAAEAKKQLDIEVLAKAQAKKQAAQLAKAQSRAQAKASQKAASAEATANDGASTQPRKRSKTDHQLTDPQRQDHGASQARGKGQGQGQGKDKGWNADDALEDARSQKNVESLHFIRLTGEYISIGKSQTYINSVTRAAKLTPAERSALLVDLARMIEADQTKTLHLLEHSVRVCQHFADEAKQHLPATK